MRQNAISHATNAISHFVAFFRIFLHGINATNAKNATNATKTTGLDDPTNKQREVLVYLDVERAALGTRKLDGIAQTLLA
jgi:hypothetical protein